MAFKTKAEKKAFRAGCSTGYRKAKSNKQVTPIKGKGPVFKGPTCVNGKFYDTNFHKPIEIKKSSIPWLREQYDFNGKSTDAEIVDRYVSHMRSKFGVFKNGEFIGILSETKK